METRSGRSTKPITGAKTWCSPLLHDPFPTMHREKRDLWAGEKVSRSQVPETDRGKLSTKTARLGSGALNLIHVKCFISCHRKPGQ